MGFTFFPQEVVTKASLGLGNVDNTADIDKEVSTLQAAADTAAKARANHTGTQLAATISDFDTAVAAIAQVTSVAGRTGAVTLTKSDVGLSNVDNTADSAKSVSTAQQTALDLKANLASPTLTGVPVAPTATALTSTTQLATTAFTTSADTAASTLDRDRANHTGTQSADTLTDGSTNKAFLATERTKLTGIATAATANSTDATLLARANHTGTQLASTVSDFNTAADARITAQKGAASGLAPLDSGSKIASSYLPAIAITSVYTVGSQVAQLALTAKYGDVAIRTDLGQTYIQNSGSAGTMADWTLLATPTDLVTSVAGRTGVITLAKADVGLANVDNTADSAKPISTAEQTALDLKAPLASPAFTGTATFGADTTLYRSAADILKTDDSFVSAGLYIDGTRFIARTGGAGTYGYYHSASDALGNSLTVLVTGDANPRINLTTAGVLNLGAGGGTATDTNLYRSAADTLKTDDTFNAVTGVQINGTSVLARSTHTGTQLAATISDFAATAATAAPVQSVASRTGAVVLTKTDVGLANVDNTSDVGKPVSTAQQTALNLKADLAGPTFTGTPTLPTGTIGVTQSAADSSTKLATTAFVTTADNLKADLAGPTFTGTPTLPTGTIGVTQTAGNSTTALATTAFVTTADNLKANLASPTFTGTPTLPTGTIGTTQTAGNSTTALATTAFVTTADNLKANIASPTFTGTPAAPTASAATSTTQLATTAFVTTADNLKADLASPTLTGTPTAPTATAGTSTTQLATTAFVAAAVTATVSPIISTMKWSTD